MSEYYPPINHESEPEMATLILDSIHDAEVLVSYLTPYIDGITKEQLTEQLSNSKVLSAKDREANGDIRDTLYTAHFPMFLEVPAKPLPKILLDVTDAIGKNMVQGQLEHRKEFDLYNNVRPLLRVATEIHRHIDATKEA
jgi:hypothetical protein